MSDPYNVLNVPPAADDETIRAAYLAAIRESPPDRDSRRFEQIRTAYEKIATARKRMSFALFAPATVSFDDIIRSVSADFQPRRPNTRQILHLLGGK